MLRIEIPAETSNEESKHKPPQRSPDRIRSEELVRSLKGMHDRAKRDKSYVVMSPSKSSARSRKHCQKDCKNNDGSPASEEATFHIAWELRRCIREELGGDSNLTPFVTISGDSFNSWAISFEG
jgi:hypothetical protein